MGHWRAEWFPCIGRSELPEAFPQKRHRKKQQVDLPMFTTILLGLKVDILAEGAIALSVTLSGGALFAS